MTSVTSNEYLTVEACGAHSEAELRKEESSVSGISWATVFGGAFIALAVTLILLPLGAGLGFSAVSPWSNAGVSDTAFGVGAALVLIIFQAIAFGVGGYVAKADHLAREAADTARKAARKFSFWSFIALLIGAFSASYAAAIGGDSRNCRTVDGVKI
jgi:hypothetical protein